MWIGNSVTGVCGPRGEDGVKMKEVLSINAHVFQIDPVSRKSWVPFAKDAIPISYIVDDQGTYRIEVKLPDTGECVVDSVLQDSMHFTKTSQKFGQWTDQKANTVYGVGFLTEDELQRFTDEFEKGISPPRSRHSSSTSPSKPPAAVAAASAASAASGGDDGAREPSSTDQLTQLKYENERLKIALGTSSANAKRWEQELQTLKNNNARLKTALQESAHNVEEWKAQLTAWREESTRMKAQVHELESQLEGSPSGPDLSALEQRLRRAEEERDSLSSQLAAARGKSGPAKEVIAAQTSTISRIEQNLTQQLRDIQSVRAGLSGITFD